jgi:hypothetical protein
MITMMLLHLFFIQKWNNNTVRKRSTGAEYWQNRADYVPAKLNAQNNEIVGTDIITYTNNSPDTMSFIWMNLDQNLFKSDSRGNAVVPLTGSRNGAQGGQIKSVKIVSSSKGKSTEVDAKFIITDTRMQVFLPQGLKAKGEQ